MNKDTSKFNVKRACKITLDVLSYMFFAVCLISLVLSLSLKRDPDGAANIFGHQVRIVRSDSMAECKETDVSEFKIKDIPVKSMLFIELVPEDEENAKKWYSELKVGDVLTFRYVYIRQETITHRIVEISENEDGGFLIFLEGDNKSSDSDTLTQIINTSQKDSPNYIIGKVTSQSYFLGLLITAVKSPVGIICIIILPCLIIAVFEIIRLVGAITEGKRKKEREESLKRDAEFEEMKRQLELLKQAQDKNEKTDEVNKE